MPEYAKNHMKGGHAYCDPVAYIAYQDQIRDLVHHPFATPSGKIEIFSRSLFDMGVKGIPAIPQYTPCIEGAHDPIRTTYPLQLIGWHSKRRTHSIHDNNPWMEEIESQCVWIHPKDAKNRNIQQGEIIEVFNDRGTIRMPAKITDRIIESTVAIPQGAWYAPDSCGIDTRGSINVLTSARPTPLAKGTAQHTALVDVRKIKGATFPKEGNPSAISERSIQ